MEHEVYVPFSVGTVRQALTDPVCVARCVPGIQLDADGDPAAPEGRLRLRIGSSTITYRGTLHLTAPADAPDTVVVRASGTESRGDGSAELALTVRLSEAESGEGTTLTCSGTVHSQGRLAEAAPQTAETAARRLLDRFAEALTTHLTEAASAPDAPEPSGTAEPTASEVSDSEPAVSETLSGDPDQADTAHDPDHPDHHGVFDTEVPPPSLDPLADDDVADAAPAEAAHARRTMIGRSAEEVDHAPPRGRYAPVPAPETTSTSATLRWAAPAAAAVLASAVVVGRVLRRRR